MINKERLHISTCKEVKPDINENLDLSSGYKIKHKKPFESLKFCYGTISDDEWIMLVERVFFLIGTTLRLKQPLDISIEEVIAKKPESYSIIHKIIIDYEEKLKVKHFGLENE